MPENDSGDSSRARKVSHFARILGQGQGSLPSNPHLSRHGGPQEAEDHCNGFFNRRHDSSPSRSSFSSHNQKQPARSFFQTSIHESHPTAIDVTRDITKEVREETAELASMVLSDIALHRSDSPPQPPKASMKRPSSDPHLDRRLEIDKGRQESMSSLRPTVIEEVSEPSSASSSQKSGHRSALTKMLRQSPATEEESDDTDLEEEIATYGVQAASIGNGIISQPSERTPLIKKRSAHGLIKDLESQDRYMKSRPHEIVLAVHTSRERTSQFMRAVANPKSWNKHDIWHYGIRQPASCIPPIMIGLLLNVLDALSYGMILFPVGNVTFNGLGPDGISIFYLSCIVAQLTYSMGGSAFRGATGSEMIEVVPFFHKMAFTVLTHVGPENRAAVLATTITAYALSSILTGLVFFILGYFHLGSLIGFFPRHILLGCIGGVGLFLVFTGFEVSSRLDGNVQFDMATLKHLLQKDVLILWIVPLILAILLHAIKRKVKSSLTDTVYLLSIFAIFYFFVFAFPNLKMSDLREKGWIFEAPTSGVPWYHFYTMYKFNLVDLGALAATVPAMLALTFFSILHVPINIPALAVSLDEDNLDVDRELKAHGISNALSGLLGSVQNYLVYTNTLLFVRSGGDNRVAGVLLAFATFGVMCSGPAIIGFIPVMVVGTLIFFLGFELMIEALILTYPRAHRLEYITIIIIVVTMGAWDFVIGIFLGIVLACVSYVVQTSRISAIRGKLFGGVANSTVRRHPIQQRYLEIAGKQIHLMKLAGFLFFGTIVGVEKQIRQMLEDFETQPIRFLVLDFFNVDGIDFSAAETFLRINRILSVQGVQLVICGVTMESEGGKALKAIGLFQSDDGIAYFQSLNSALEFSENELLKTFYAQRDAEAKMESTPSFIDIPKAEERSTPFSVDAMYDSPRQHHLHKAATETLSEQNHAPPSKWQDYAQPQKLILQTFSTVSDKPEEFWYRIVPYFALRSYTKGTVLYEAGDVATAFYLLESGLLKAKYDLPQGKYSELLVAGTTCGELPFFSDTARTSTTTADTDCIAWILDLQKWQLLQKEEPDVAQELLKVSLKLTTERFENITKYMLLTSG